MRWLSFVRNGQDTYGYIVTDESGAEGVVDVGAKTQYPTLKKAIEAQALETLPASCGDQPDLTLQDIIYAPTITDPAKILCVGLNYKEHQEETGRGGEGFPTIFVRFAAAQMGHMQPMVRPIESSTLD
jgi:2-keto-4-pentenoate hydratase/2-oxohepta-3-ene-1,7-dioic acid hydratase in catechol pathway